MIVTRYRFMVVLQSGWWLGELLRQRAFDMEESARLSHFGRRLQRSAASETIAGHKSIHNVSICDVKFSHLLLVVLYLHLVFFGVTSVRAQALRSQGSSLKALARAWSVSFADWEQSEDPCVGGWSGVACDNATKTQVVVLNLTSKGLKGRIPRAISELVYLRELYLDNNTIHDPIPAEIGKLTKLQILSINQNNLTSPPPEALLTCNLTHLSLNRNRMSGQLPTWIGRLSNLVLLDMYANEFWGGLPPEYGKLKNLKEMEIWENQLSGFVPDEWRHMTSMERYGVGHQYLTGPVPEWLFELPKMKYAGFYRNQFLGPFPNISKLMHNGISNLTHLRFGCSFLQGDYATLYYKVLPVPTTIIQSHGNCFNNETDTNPTNSNINATQNTPKNCSRIWDCQSFYAQVAKNPGHCAPCPPSQVFMDVSKCICGKDLQASSNFPVRHVVGGIVGGVCATIVVILVVFIVHRKGKPRKYPQFGRTYQGSKEPWNVPKGLRRISLQELEIGTDYFSEVNYIGKGGFGSVYHGILSDEKHVAIKCASLHTAQGQQQFRNELILLSRLHHRHLVALVGFCDEDGLQILVYEFIENGNLHDNLFGRDGRDPLNSHQRIHVALGIAKGLEYLHTCATPPVIHRDIKPSNILLDLYMVAKLADFGISKVSSELNTHVSTRPLGTMGYLDPDYFRTNQLTTASDIYALGVVLLEIITGQPIIDYTRLDAPNLIEWVRPRFKQGGIKAIIDPKLKEDLDEDLYTNIVELADQCTLTDRFDRPSVQDVLRVLEPHAKVQKDLPYDSMWAKSHFKNDSLFEKETSFRFLDELRKSQMAHLNDHPTPGYESQINHENVNNTVVFESIPYSKSS